MATGYAGLQASIQNTLGGLSTPGAFAASVSGDPSLTTTAVNVIIVANGIPQGLIKSYSIDENFNTQRVKALSSAINVALLPGVYEATGSINRAFLYNENPNVAMGGTIRPINGRYLTDADFTKFYFNIVETNSLGVPIAVRHDCVMMSGRRAYDIDQVVVYDDIQLLIRWSEE